RGADGGGSTQCSRGSEQSSQVTSRAPSANQARIRSRAPSGGASPVQRSLTRMASTLARRIGVPRTGFKRSGPRYCGRAESRDDILCPGQLTTQPVGVRSRVLFIRSRVLFVLAFARSRVLVIRCRTADF